MTRDEAEAALARHRDEIDELDRRILDLLNQRTRVVEEIGRIKKENGLPIYEPRREDQVFRNVIGNNRGPISAEALKRIYERIIDEMRTLQKMRNER
jgi:chorismate mutase